jgi:DNA gyrase subunit B
VEKARLDKVLENKEIQSLVAAIGCGIGDEDFDILKRRYFRVVIMTDADVDGSHIRTLLLTFFYRQMKPLIESGSVYIAKPPLFKVRRRKKERYIDTEEQLDTYLSELGSEDIEIKDGNGQPVTKEIAMKLTEIFSKVQHAGNGLHRYGIDPVKYFGMMNGDGKFPLALINVRENDGTTTQKYVYTPEEEAEFIKITEERLAAAIGELPAVDAETTPEQGPAAEENAPESQIELEIREKISSAVDLISIFEAKHCEEIAVEVKKHNLSIDSLFEGPDKLFEVTSGEKVEPAKSLKDLFELIKKNGRQGLQIQRYKGLGEMNAEQLWETTMDPVTRKMIKVTMEDAVQAERMFTLLMGDIVEPRRDYIEKYAATVKDLDI